MSETLQRPDNIFVRGEALDALQEAQKIEKEKGTRVETKIVFNDQSGEPDFYYNVEVEETP